MNLIYYSVYWLEEQNTRTYPLELTNKVECRMLQKLQKILFYLITVLGILLIVITFTQVIVRYTSFSIILTEETALFVLVYSIFIGAAINVKNDNNFRLKYVENMLPPVPKKYLKLFIHIVVLIILVVFVWGSIIFTQNGFHRTFPITRLKKAWVYVVMPISGIIMIFYEIDNLIKDLKS